MDHHTTELDNQEICHLTLKGELSYESIPPLDIEITQALKHHSKVSLNLALVTQGDNAAIGMLVSAAARAKKMSKTIYFAEVPEQILRLAEALGVAEILFPANKRTC